MRNLTKRFDSSSISWYVKYGQYLQASTKISIIDLNDQIGVCVCVEIPIKEQCVLFKKFLKTKTEIEPFNSQIGLHV